MTKNERKSKKEKKKEIEKLLKKKGIEWNHPDYRRRLKSTMKHQRKHSLRAEKKETMSTQIQALKEQLQHAKMTIDGHKTVMAEKDKSIKSFIETQESLQEKIVSLKQKNEFKIEEIRRLNEQMTVNHKEDAKQKLNERKESEKRRSIERAIERDLKQQNVSLNWHHKEVMAKKEKLVESIQEKIASLEQKNWIQTEEIQGLNESNVSIK